MSHVGALAAVLLVCGISAAAGVQAEIGQHKDAKLLYQLYCQGCHGPDGAGGAGVPRVKDHIGTFLRSQAGREYLVRVPGASTSVLDDGELATVMNWVILEFGGESIPSDFRPYTGEEVGPLRRNPLNELIEYRRKLLAEIDAIP